MNRRHFLRLGALLCAAALCNESLAAILEQIGNLTVKQFDEANQQGAAAVEAVEITSAPLSEADRALALEIAEGGTMQLSASILAAKKAKHPAVRAFAEAEALEQTGLKKKLMQMSAAKGFEIPATVEDKATVLTKKLADLADEKFDREYLAVAGVKGHKMLEATMTKVGKSATDTSLQALALAALPLIKTHLAVAEAEAA